MHSREEVTRERVLEDAPSHYNNKEAFAWIHGYETAIERIQALEASRGEAVAWAVDYVNDHGGMGRIFIAEKEPGENYAKAGYVVTPLYAHPPAASVPPLRGDRGAEPLGVTEEMCSLGCKEECLADTHGCPSECLNLRVRAALTASRGGG